MTTTPEPPKGRRWLDGGQLIQRTDWVHHFDRTTGKEIGSQFSVFIGCVAVSRDDIRYSRAIRRKTNRKQLK